MKKKTTKKKPAAPSAKPETVLCLRTCDSQLRAHGGFQWPESGPISAPDWKPTKTCGNGLHGLAKGEGDGSLLNWGETAKWLVVEVEKDLLVDLEGKVKFPHGVVVFCGDRLGATKMISKRHPEAVVHGGTATAGDSGTATAGNSGTATAGYAGTATAGDSGTATAGTRGTATAGYAGTATAGDSGTATAGNSGTATAGDSGTATAGDSGTATAGTRGTATAGYAGTATAGYSGTATAGTRGTATAGNSGTATAGTGGTATAGELAEIQIKFWDAKANRYRTKIGWIGEDGLKANIKYRLNDSNQFEEVKS